MMSFFELKQKIETALEELWEKGDRDTHKMESLVSQEDIAQCTATELLVLAVENRLMVAACSGCTSLGVAGKWVAPSKYTHTVKENYGHLTWGSCDDHWNLYGIEKK